MDNGGDSPDDASSVRGERTERLAAALRANLKRRKEQARARSRPAGSPSDDKAVDTPAERG